MHDATQLQAGRQLELRCTSTDLVSLARQCVLRQQHTSESRVLGFETQIDELVGIWDPPRLERVLGNLQADAIKYSPPGGAVLVDVRREAEWAVLSVADHGIGIPPAEPAVYFRTLSPRQ